MTVVFAIAASAQMSKAMLYSANNADLLLLFRSDSVLKNVEVDIGGVTNLLNLAPGASTNFSVYSTNQVKTNFANSFSTVLFTVIGVNAAGKGNGLWVTDFSDTTPPGNFASGAYTTVRGLIQSIGTSANGVTGNVAGSNYVAASTATTSYSYILTTGQGQAAYTVSSFGGQFPFTDEALAGNTQNFYQLNNTGSGSATLVGTFSMDATSGAVTFTRANATAVTLVPSRINTIQRYLASNQTYIGFTTTNGNNYQLLYKTNLTQATWTTNAAAGVVVGDNSNKAFYDTTTDAQRYYRVQSF